MIPALEWRPDFRPADALTLIGFVFTVTALVFTGFQLRRNSLVQRAQFLLSATERYFADSEVRRLYYDIDYGQFTIQFNDHEPATFCRRGSPAKAFIGSDEERWLDNLLYTFDTIGRIVELRMLSWKEASIFAFQAVRVFQNATIQKYLEWLGNERRKFGGELPTHRAARALVAETLKRLERT